MVSDVGWFATSFKLLKVKKKRLKSQMYVAETCYRVKIVWQWKG